MKKSCFALSIAAFALTGCTAATELTLPAGRMTVAGDIRPCEPDRRGAQSCGNAIFNAPLIGQVHKGQTPADVRAIMRHDAERREVGSLTESWGYLTSYENKMMTWITFTNQRVTSLSHEVLTRD
jgi:hypothetical protein